MQIPLWIDIIQNVAIATKIKLMQNNMNISAKHNIPINLVSIKQINLNNSFVCIDSQTCSYH